MQPLAAISARAGPEQPRPRPTLVSYDGSLAGTSEGAGTESASLEPPEGILSVGGPMLLDQAALRCRRVGY